MLRDKRLEGRALPVRTDDLMDDVLARRVAVRAEGRCGDVNAGGFGFGHYRINQYILDGLCRLRDASVALRIDIAVTHCRIDRRVKLFR